MQAFSADRRPSVDSSQLARLGAAVFGLIALICFYQPWVEASLPNVGDSVLTGLELARGEAAERVDAASAPVAGVRPGSSPRPGTASGGGASSGGLVLPTRIPTVAPGAAAPGGLTLPTRIPTVAPSSGAGAASARGLTLPTRISTVAPGGAAGASEGQGISTGAVIATQAAATRIAFQTAEAGQTSSGSRAGQAFVEEKKPEALPTLSLYAVPLAAAGLAIFAAIWGRLSDPKDRRYGKFWTVILSVGGAAGVGYVLYKVAGAPAPNNLLDPGDVKAPLWGLWGTFLAFLLASVSLAIAWTRPSPLEGKTG
ncbi:MAG: hypothetical protein HY332_15160 [Chloroflexi bacterium]|nr:hypothetical protein [Chloroflexota bacterium]